MCCLGNKYVRIMIVSIVLFLSTLICNKTIAESHSGKNKANTNENSHISLDNPELPVIENTIPDSLSEYDHKNLKLYWNEEFNKSILDENTWTIVTGNGCPVLCGFGNGELQIYTPDNLKVSKGHLIITAKQKGLFKKKKYTSARINTEGKVSVKYGRIDFRARLPQGKGIWPALWMMGDSKKEISWPGCGEIDVVELRGSKPYRICGTVHYQNISGNHQYPKAGCYDLETGNFSDDFHTFSLIWEESRLIWLVDNIPFYEVKSTELNMNPESGQFNQGFFILINLAVGGRYDGNPDKKTKFPQQLEVDYVRAYEKR